MRHGKEQGVATILFVMMVPALFGIFYLGSDAAYSIQTRARLLDGVEAASLAVSAQASDDEDKNRTLVGHYLDQYVGQRLDGDSITVTKRHCEDIPECILSLESGGQRYYQYDVAATVTRESWFGDESKSFMPTTMDIGARSVVNKYQNTAIDVALVADFSGSMQYGWTGGEKTKIEDLYDVVSDVLKELQKYNDLESEDKSTKSTVAFVPYNRNVSPIPARVVFKDTITEGDYSKYFDSDKDLSLYHNKINDNVDIEEYRMCYRNYIVPNSHSNISNSEANETVLNMFNYEYHNSNNSSVGELIYFDLDGKFIDRTDNQEVNCKGDYKATNSTVDREDYRLIFQLKSSFWNIDFTDDFEALKTTMRTFKPWWGTASYQGLISGAQLFDARVKAGSANDRRLIILLSDGLDNFPTTMEMLHKNNLCTEIREQLSDAQEGIYAKLALIGFDYDVNDSKNKYLRECIGNDNVYRAQNKDDILNTILELITEEIGRLTPDK